MFNQELIEILVCPKCKGKIHLSNNEEYIVCDNCRLAYPITSQKTPIMLIDEAKNLDEIIKG